MPNRAFNRILNAVTSPSFYNVYVNLPNEESQLDSYISDNPSSSPISKEHWGHWMGPTSMHDLQLRIIHVTANRKGLLTQNVLAATTLTCISVTS